MEEESKETCMQRCEDEFIKLTASKPVGGVEALRICRDACRAMANGRVQNAKEG